MEQDKKVEIEFFDKFGIQADYDVFDESGYKRILNEFLKHVDSQLGLKVIDFGCGTGAFTARLSEYSFEIYGIDISPECVRYAKEAYGNINFSAGDVEKTDFVDNTFDVVFMSGLLHHFPDFTKVASEAKRILKPGGKILAYDPHSANPAMWLYRCRKSPFFSSIGVTKNEQPLNKRKIRETFEKIGFCEVKIYAVSGITYKYVESKTAGRILWLYNLFEKILDKTPLRNYFGSFLITYAKK